MKYPARKKFFVRRKKAKKAKVAKLSKPMVKAVQKIFHKDAETKQAVAIQGLTAFNSGITAQGDLLQIIPSISQGINDNSRIGDQVRAQRLNLRGYMIMAQGYSTALNACRIGVRMMIVNPKNYTSYDAAYANWATWTGALLKKGGATTQFTGIVSDLYAQINTELVTTLYDKVHYLSVPYYAVSTAVGIAIQDLHKTTKFFNISVPLRNKLFRYDSAVNFGVTPVNYNYFLLLGYVHLDGSAVDTVNTQVSLAYDSYLDYEDA